jgi:hypothetical protein
MSTFLNPNQVCVTNVVVWYDMIAFLIST